MVRTNPFPFPTKSIVKGDDKVREISASIIRFVGTKLWKGSAQAFLSTSLSEIKAIRRKNI